MCRAAQPVTALLPNKYGLTRRHRSIVTVLKDTGSVGTVILGRGLGADQTLCFFSVRTARRRRSMSSPHSLMAFQYRPHSQQRSPPADRFVQGGPSYKILKNQRLRLLINT